ncbi:MAG: hypothetical protein R2875_12235 [Desulfobacterales bacterium]
MIVTGCIQMRDFYRSLRGGVLLLIAGTIALGHGNGKNRHQPGVCGSFFTAFSAGHLRRWS